MKKAEKNCEIPDLFPDDEEKSGVLFRIPEWFAAVLTALLPVKFASIVSVPEMPSSYWFDAYSIVLTAWPLACFQIGAAVLLLCCLPFVWTRKKPFRSPQAACFAGLWCLLALISLRGAVNASCGWYVTQMIAYVFALAAYAVAVFLLLEHRRGFASMLYGALITGCLLSVASGLYQYFIGFEVLKQHVYDQNLQAGREVISGQFLSRIYEARVQADFSICNTYGGYLALLLPFVSFAAWHFGNTRVQPEKTSRWILSVPLTICMLFLIVQTGSRGAFFSLLGGFILLGLCLKLDKKLRMILAGIILLGIAGFFILVLSGRGFKSMYFRFDYDLAGLRMMLAHPYSGTGWGDFFHDFQQLKLFQNEEAPHTPHNMLILFGSQCSLGGLLASLGLLLLPMWEACRRLRKTVAAAIQTDPLLLPLVFSLFIAICDSMLEISFETPAFIAVYTVLAFLLFYRPEEKAEKEKGPKMSLAFPSATKILLTILTASLGVTALVLSWRFMQKEYAFSKIYERIDFRFSRNSTEDTPQSQPQPDEVVRLLKEATEIAPENPFPWALAADYFLSRNDLRSAMYLISEAIKRSPERAAFYHRRAMIRYLLTGDPAGSADDLNQMRRLFPKNPEYFVPDLELLRLPNMQQ